MPQAVIDILADVNGWCMLDLTGEVLDHVTHENVDAVMDAVMEALLPHSRPVFIKCAATTLARSRETALGLRPHAPIPPKEAFDAFDAWHARHPRVT